MYAEGQCKRLKVLQQHFKSSFRAFDQNNETTEWRHKLKHYLEEESKPSLYALYDTFRAMEGNGMTLPSDITPETMAFLDRYSTMKWWDSYTHSLELPRLGIGRFLKELHSEMCDAVTRRTSAKMSIFSGFHLFDCSWDAGAGHDSTIAPVLCAFEVFDNKWPSFASHVTFEVYECGVGEEGGAASSVSPPPSSKNGGVEGNYVRMLYNSKKLEIPFCVAHASRHHPSDSSLCSWAAFSEAISRVIPVDREAECLNDILELQSFWINKFKGLE